MDAGGFRSNPGGKHHHMTVPIMSQPAWGRMQALVEIRESLRLRPEGREFTDHNLAEHIVG